MVTKETVVLKYGGFVEQENTVRFFIQENTLLFLLSGMLILYITWKFPWESKPLAGFDFSLVEPRYGWVMWGFPALSYMLIGIFAIFFFKQGFVLIFHCMCILNGLFASITSVYPLPGNRKYLYVKDKRARWVGLVQLATASILIYPVIIEQVV